MDYKNIFILTIIHFDLLSVGKFREWSQFGFFDVG